MNRLFYFTGHRMRLLHWSGKHFKGAYSFEPDENGYAKFQQYLESSAKSPTRLLIDVIEEDFRVESVPHVFGKDRKAVIGRMVDRYYRSSKNFTYSEIIGREKTGRKDYQVILGALTNPDILTRWLDIIEQAGVPLSGIWSLPLVSKSILPLLDAKSGPVLLVSQQVNSNLRQTFFRDGKMVSSRQSVINQDASDISKIGEFARPEVERTILYLRNQQLIRKDEVLNVHMLGSDEQIRSLQDNFSTSARDSIHIHNIRALEDKAGFKGYQSQFADGIYAWLCTRQVHGTGHYDGGIGKERYKYSLMSAALYAASIFVLVFGLLMTESYISDAIQYTKASDLLVEQEKEYRRVYRKKFEAYEEVFANAGVMNAAVDLARQIESHGEISPLDLYVQLSDVIKQARLDDITIDAISWKAEQISEVQGKQEVKVAEPKVLVKDEIRHAAVIKGRIAISKDNYSESVDRIQDIIDALSDHERVVKAVAIEMPVEIRSDKRFAGEIGGGKGRKDKDEGNFSLRVIMRGEADA